MKYLRTALSLLVFVGIYGSAQSQAIPYTMASAHSHNDYEHSLPFYDAYARHFGSIEADVWAVNDTLFIAHNRNQITPDRTFRSLYLLPLIHRLKINDGQPYEDGQPLQLLIDLKSSHKETMPILEKEFKPYRQYFGNTNAKHVRIVISGSMPPPDNLHYFDSIFTFDGRLRKQYPTADLQRIKLVSADVQKLISWHSNDTLNSSQFHVLKQVVDSVHQQKKLIRFWATPNSIEAYEALMKLGVDYIGTDDLFRLECLVRKENTTN